MSRTYKDRKKAKVDSRYIGGDGCWYCLGRPRDYLRRYKRQLDSAEFDLKEHKKEKDQCFI